MLHILLSLVYRTDEDYWMQLKVVSMCKIAKIESWYNKHSKMLRYGTMNQYYDQLQS